jgi:hypothetical protein
MYAAAFGVVLCALYTAMVGLELRDPLFGATVLGLCTLGFAVSLVARSNPSTGWVLAALVGSLVGVVALSSSSGGAASPLFPGRSSGDVHRDLGVFLCWLLVLLSFAQLSRGWLLFTCVPAAAVMGLVGTVYAEPAFLGLFLTYVFLGTFLVVHDQHETLIGDRPVRASSSRRGTSFVGQLYVVAACSVGSVFVARIVAQPMQDVGSTLVPLGSVAGQDQDPARRRSAARVRVSESSELLIGTGPETDSDTVLMRVRAEHGGYWRGATFDVFTGSGWRSSLRADLPAGPSPSRGLPSAMFDPRMRQSVDIAVPRSEMNDTPGPTHTLRQYFRLENTGRFTDLYGAAEARVYRLLDPGDFGPALAATADEAGRIALSRPIASTYYEVESDVVEWTAETLRSAPERAPERIAAAYAGLQLPAGAPRLRELAQTVTAGAGNNYDRVVALRDYLSSTCLYNLQAPAIAVGSSDVVSSFVFDVKQGDCKLFGSALAVLCRSVAIPARVASGFLSGEFDADGQYYTVRERDKHLWTEVYFPGYGWVPFDATTDARDVTPRDDDQGLLSGKGWLGALLRRGVLPPFALGLGLVLVAWVAVAEYRRRYGGGQRRLMPTDLSAEAARVLAAYGGMSRKLARRGLDRAATETPAEYRVRVRSALAGEPDAVRALERLTELVVLARYGGGAIEPVAAASARELVGVVIAGVRRADRARRARRQPSVQTA